MSDEQTRRAADQYVSDLLRRLWKAEDAIADLRRVLLPPPTKEIIDGGEVNIEMRGSLNLLGVFSEVRQGNGALDNVQQDTIQRCMAMLSEAEQILEDAQ